MRYVGYAAAAIAALALGGHIYLDHLQAEKIRNLEWDVSYWKGELYSSYEQETLEPTYLDGQCCSPEGEGCNEPIYGSDC